MNRPEFNTTAAILDIKVDYQTNFIQTIEYLIDSILQDFTYYEADFIVYLNNKNYAEWTLALGGITNPSTGTLKINQYIDFGPGQFYYYFKLMDGDGNIRKYIKGNFIVE